MGLTFLLNAAFLLPLTVGALVVAVGALGFRARRRHGFGPLAVGLAAALFLIVGKFVLGLDAITYGGMGLLIGASLWNAWPKKQAPSELVQMHVSHNPLKQEGE